MINWIKGKEKPKRGPRRRTDQERAERRRAKREAWAEEEIIEIAKVDPKIKYQLLSAHLGYELKPTTAEDKFREDIWRQMSDLAIETLDRDPKLAKRYVNAFMMKTFGISVEELLACDELSKNQAKPPQDSLKQFAEQVKSYNSIMEALGMHRSPAAEIMQVLVSFANSPLGVDVGRALGMFLSRWSSPPGEISVVPPAANNGVPGPSSGVGGKAETPASTIPQLAIGDGSADKSARDTKDMKETLANRSTG